MVFIITQQTSSEVSRTFSRSTILGLYVRCPRRFTKDSTFTNATNQATLPYLPNTHPSPCEWGRLVLHPVLRGRSPLVPVVLPHLHLGEVVVGLLQPVLRHDVLLVRVERRVDLWRLSPLLSYWSRPLSSMVVRHGEVLCPANHRHVPSSVATVTLPFTNCVSGPATGPYGRPP